MKALIKILLSGSLVCAGYGYASAQSAASSSKEVIEQQLDTVGSQIPDVDTIQTDFRTNRGIPTPPHVEKLLTEGNVAQALSEFEKFKTKQKKVNPYHLLYCEMTVYQQASMQDSNYFQKAEDLRQEIINKYPDVSDTYLLRIEANTTDKEIVELTTKAIELDPENISAYDSRGRALFNLKQIKEACADFEKLPWKGNMPEYWECNKL